MGLSWIVRTLFCNSSPKELEVYIIYPTNMDVAQVSTIMVDNWVPISLGEFSFAVYDVGSNQVETFDPNSDTTVTYNRPDHSGPPKLHRGDAERGVQAMYREEGYEVRDINHKYNSPLRNALQLRDAVEHRFYRKSPDPWTEVKTRICNLVKQHTSADSDQATINRIDGIGIPDLLIRQEADQDQFSFVEVKRESERLNPDQQAWITNSRFLPIKIAKIFPEQTARDHYVDNTTVKDILSGV